MSVFGKCGLLGARMAKRDNERSGDGTDGFITMLSIGESTTALFFTEARQRGWASKVNKSAAHNRYQRTLADGNLNQTRL